MKARSRGSNASPRTTVAAFLVATGLSQALSGPPETLAKPCQADLPIAKDEKQRAQAEKLLLKILPSFHKGYFSDYSVVAKVEAETKSFVADGCQEDAYGELPVEYASSVFSFMKLGPTDTFEDLGSGLGKLTMAAVVLGGVKHAFGVELSAARHKTACATLQNASHLLSKEFPGAAKGRVQLRMADMLKEDLTKATALFASSICFRHALLNMMGKKLGSELPAGGRIAMTKNFPQQPAGLTFQGKPKAGGVVPVFVWQRAGKNVTGRPTKAKAKEAATQGHVFAAKVKDAEHQPAARTKAKAKESPPRQTRVFRFGGGHLFATKAKAKTKEAAPQSKPDLRVSQGRMLAAKTKAKAKEAAPQPKRDLHVSQGHALPAKAKAKAKEAVPAKAKEAVPQQKREVRVRGRRPY